MGIRSVAALGCLALAVGCGGAGDSGSGRFDGGEEQNPWDPPPSCDELYLREFLPTGGDPSGEWIPVQLCYRHRGTGHSNVPGCDDYDIVEDRTFLVESLTIDLNGRCSQQGSGISELVQTFLPLPDCASPGQEPEEWCEGFGFPAQDYPDLDVRVGSESCVPDNEASLCVCTVEREFGEKYLMDSCQVAGSSMVRGTGDLVEEYGFSVQGAYLIRKLLRFPNVSPPRDNGEPAHLAWSFEIYRRAASESSGGM